MSKDHDCQFFYLVYEGIMEIRNGSKLVKKLHSGDFFGEVHLLQYSVSEVDLVAETECRCLVMSRADFLAILGKDYRLGLQFEHIAAQRLKEPVFPLKEGINSI